MDTGQKYFPDHIERGRRDVRQLSVPPQRKTADPDSVLRRKAGDLSELDEPVGI